MSYIVILILACIPSLLLGKIGLGFVFSSVFLFYDLIPIQPLAALAWAAYVCVAYIICLMFAYKKWEKERLHKRV